MRTQLNPIAQDPNAVRLLLLADAAYESWSEQRRAENEADFDSWLNSPEGQEWLDNELEIDAERRCLSVWNGW